MPGEAPLHFLVDAQLPPALARWLTAEGCPSAHVADCGLLNASDAAIWDFAAQTGSVLMTKDGDFAVRRVVAVGPPPVVWLRFPNKRTPELLDYLARILPFIAVELEHGDLLVEVR